MDLRAGLLAAEEVTTEELKSLTKLMVKDRGNEQMDFLFYILGEDLLLFLDTFSGETLRIPKREEVMRDIDHIKIYNYVKSNADRDDIESKAAIRFQRRKQSITRIVNRVERIMGGEGIEE